jgi:hypothetical protein
MKLPAAHTWMTLPNTLNQFHDELVFGCPLHLPLPRLVVRLSTDAEPVTGRPLINPLYRAACVMISSRNFF